MLAVRRVLMIAPVAVIALLACSLGPIASSAHAARFDAGTPSCGGPVVNVASAQTASIMRDPNVAAAVQGLTQQIEAARQSSQLPSISIALVYNQDVLFAGGFGCANFEQNVAATPSTVYRIGSVTKMFVATMLMQLRDLGYVASLDDHLDQYLPQVYFLLPDGSRYSPTFRQLVSHSSGLPDASPNVNTEDALWRTLERTTVKFQPGTDSSYSDYGYLVLGQSLADIAGVSYHDWVDDYILAPLGMATTTFDISTLDPTQLAEPYTQFNVSNKGVKTVVGDYSNPFPAQGELLSNVLDMAQFIKMQFGGGNAVLAGSTISEMMQPVIATTASDEGTADLGWFTQSLGDSGYTRVAKNGGVDGFTTLLAMIPADKLGIIAFENLSGGQISGPGDEQKLENAILKQFAPLVEASPDR